MTTVLELVKNTLNEIDVATYGEELEMFNCGVKQVSDNRFSYLFDGFMLCQIEFTPYGKVIEAGDCANDTELTPDNSRVFDSLAAMRDQLIKEMKG